MRRGLALLVAMAIAGIACANRPAGLRSGPEEARPSPVPAVARVVCEATRTRILTPTVLAQRDGVLFSIENATQQTFVFFPRQDGDPTGIYTEFASSGDNSVPTGVKEMLWRFPPGPTRVACLPKGKPLPADRLRAREAVLRVVDPGRIYVTIPSELDCRGGPDRGYGLTLPIRSDDPAEPVRVTKERLIGLRPSDVVTRTGYPADRYPWVQIVRKGRVVGLVNIGPVVSSDSTTLWACVDAGIRPYHPPPGPRRPRTPSPIPTDTFPRQSELVEGGSYWVLYLAIAEKGAPELENAIGRAHLYGYSPHVRTLGCDERADGRYPLPKDFLGVALYFDRERDPWHVADAIKAPHWEPTRITARCID